jgi:hypothetical protein
MVGPSHTLLDPLNPMKYGAGLNPLWPEVCWFWVKIKLTKNIIYSHIRVCDDTFWVAIPGPADRMSQGCPPTRPLGETLKLYQSYPIFDIL